MLAVIGAGRITRSHAQALTTATATAITLEAAHEPGTCPACALARWRQTTTTIARHGWRTARTELADLGEITAAERSHHDCLNSADSPTSDSAPVPLFCPIDRHGAPETGQALSIRSITAIIARRLHPPIPHDPWPTVRTGPLGAWTNHDQARGLAERRKAADRLQHIDALLDAAEQQAERVLKDLDE